MKTFSLSFLFCAVALALSAQITSTTRIHIGESQTIALSAPSTSVTWVGTASGTVTNGTTLLTAGGTLTADGTWHWNGVPTETRSKKTPSYTIAQVRNAAYRVRSSDLAPAAYISLAKSIHLSSAATDEARMLDVIAAQDLKIFDFKKVDSYLYHQALEMGTNVRWVWKPMREDDQKASERSSWQTSEIGFVYPTLYTRKIPVRILETVAKVLKEMPDAIFMVSDFEVIKPDPFLAVTTQKLLEAHKLWIIANWDEPGYVDTPSFQISIQ
jgi:hypothetical protein